jgi:hypothetical protein
MLIAGTGRAGTSFLVKYLHALGLDTHLAHHGSPQWSALANAGLEDLPIADSSATRPYVLKSPWIGNVLDQILDDKAIAVDVALIPVRDLKAAAASRMVTEIQNIFERSAWMTAAGSIWREWGITEGGAVFSLELLDQERILAVQFARLVQKVVAADIPFVLLDFPRIVEDGAYLYEKTKAYLPSGVTFELAMTAHRRVAEADLVRVERERVASLGSSETRSDEPNALGVEALTAIALDRAIAGRKKALRELAARQALEEEKYRRLQEQGREAEVSPPPPEPKPKGLRRLLRKISAVLALDREPVSLSGPRKRRSEANA